MVTQSKLEIWNLILWNNVAEPNWWKYISSNVLYYLCSNFPRESAGFLVRNLNGEVCFFPIPVFSSSEHFYWDVEKFVPLLYFFHKEKYEIMATVHSHIGDKAPAQMSTADHLLHEWASFHVLVSISHSRSTEYFVKFYSSQEFIFNNKL